MFLNLHLKRLKETSLPSNSNFFFFLFHLFQVRDLPYPFSSVEQFQGSIRAPIGDTWNTPSAVAKLTKPSYSTKLGTIIEPIQEEVLKKGANKRRNRPKPDIELDGPKSKRVKSRKIQDKRRNRGNERKATVE